MKLPLERTPLVSLVRWGPETTAAPQVRVTLGMTAPSPAASVTQATAVTPVWLAMTLTAILLSL